MVALIAPGPETRKRARKHVSGGYIQETSRRVALPNARASLSLGYKIKEIS